jgi:hypothetical protein
VFNPATPFEAGLFIWANKTLGHFGNRKQQIAATLEKDGVLVENSHDSRQADHPRFAFSNRRPALPTARNSDGREQFYFLRWPTVRWPCVVASRV